MTQTTTENRTSATDIPEGWYVVVKEYPTPDIHPEYRGFRHLKDAMSSANRHITMGKMLKWPHKHGRYTRLYQKGEWHEPISTHPFRTIA